MRTLLFLTALFLGAPAVEAQVTVQQPVVSNVGVSTTVSVPDRGTALLGGVSRSAATRSRYGFWPRVGSSIGRTASSANITASVRIHDLRAMDEYLLGLDTGVAPLEPPAITARGMLGGYGDRRVPRSSAPTTRKPGHFANIANTDTRATDDTARARRSLQLGLQAERDGKAGLAKLHFEMAARHGSREALERLQPAGEQQIADR